MKYVISMIWHQIVGNGQQNILRARVAVLLTLVCVGEVVTAVATGTRLTGAATVRLASTAAIPFALHFMLSSTES